MIKYIIFDFDGTLVDSQEVFVAIYNKIAQTEGYTAMTPTVIAALRDMGVAERAAYLKVPLYKLPFLAAKFFRQYKASVPMLAFNPGMGELLSHLSEKQNLYAVLSSNAKDNIRSFFTINRLTVPEIYSSSKLFSKDKVLAKFLAAKRLRSCDVLYIGDEERDVIACNKLGIPIAWVSWGYDSAAALQNVKPDYLINTPQELVALIDRLTA